MTYHNNNIYVYLLQHYIIIKVNDDGWQRMNLDLHDLMSNAFGIAYKSTQQITVFGTCRVSKIYFQSEDYADCELPPFLRLIPEA